MDMKEFADYTPNKFLVVLGKMHASVFGKVEKHLKELGYNTSEFLIMYAIATHGALTIQDVAARIFVTSGNMTYTVNKLEKRGLIRRVTCSEDRRKIYVSFTDEGKANWANVLEEHSLYLKQCFENVEESDMLQMIELMKKIGKGQ